MSQLTKKEWDDLKRQIGTSSWGGSRVPPYAFTEQGVAMLSSVLRSPRAVQVNIAIMRAFVRLREMLLTISICTGQSAVPPGCPWKCPIVMTDSGMVYNRTPLARRR